MQVFNVKSLLYPLLFNYFHISRIVYPGMWVKVDDLNLVSFCSPSPPQELMLEGSAHDGGKAVSRGILA